MPAVLLAALALAVHFVARAGSSASSLKWLAAASRRWLGVGLGLARCRGRGDHQLGFLAGLLVRGLPVAAGWRSSATGSTTSTR